MTETTITNVEEGRSGYGSAPLTVSVYNFDPSLGCDDATFQPCSPRALSSLKVVGDHFKEFFPISRNFSGDQPPFFGFFTEDQFLGGHVSGSSPEISPHRQRLSRHAAAILLVLDVTRTDIKFWRQFRVDLAVPVKIGSYSKGSETYNALTKAVHEWANKIVLQLAANTPGDHVLVECVHKEKGGPYGPRGMIRSLAAALGVYDAYNGLVPPNWGHPIPERQTRDREDVFASADEIVQWDANHDDGYYRDVDPDLYRDTRPYHSPSWVRVDDSKRYRSG
jgi:glucoamylase